MSPKVTILIPTYNREEYIFEALTSASQQTVTNIEILVTDNCSTDKTIEIISEFAKKDNRVRLISNTENLGPLLNWKKGIESSRGELIKILWSDDLIDNDFLEKTIPLLSDDVGFVISKIKIGESRSKSSFEKLDLTNTNKIKSSEFIDRSLVGRNVPLSPGCALFRKKDLLDSLTLKNECFISDRFKINGAGPDLLLFLKTAFRYSYIGFSDETSSFFRYHQGSITVGEKSKLIGMDYLQAKLLASHISEHRYYLGILLEIYLRDSKALRGIQKRNCLSKNLKLILGACEYLIVRACFILKRKLDAI